MVSTVNEFQPYMFHSALSHSGHCSLILWKYLKIVLTIMISIISANAGGPYQLQRIALENPNQRTLQSAYSNPKVVHNPLPLDWRDSSQTQDNAVEGDTKPLLELLPLENMHTTEERGPSSSQGQNYIFKGVVSVKCVEESPCNFSSKYPRISSVIHFNLDMKIFVVVTAGIAASIPFANDSQESNYYFPVILAGIFSFG